MKRIGYPLATFVNNRKTEGLMLEGCKTTKIYCRIDCPGGRRMRPENRVRFTSKAEATAQGYRACLRCDPDGEPGPWRPGISRRGQRTNASIRA